MADISGDFTIDDLKSWATAFFAETAKKPKWVIVTPDQGYALRMTIPMQYQSPAVMQDGTLGGMSFFGLPVLEREKHEMIPDGSLDLRWVRTK